MHDGAARAAPTPRWIRRRSRAAGCEPIRPATSGPGQAGQCGNPRQASCNTAGCRAEAGGPRGTRLGPVLVAAPCAPRRWTRRWPGTWRHCLAVDLGSRVTVRRRHPGGHPGGQASNLPTAPGRPPRRFVGDCGEASLPWPGPSCRTPCAGFPYYDFGSASLTSSNRLQRPGSHAAAVFPGHTSCRLGLGGRLEFSWNTADVRRRATKQQVIWGAPPWPRPACAENGPSTLVLLTPEPSRRGDREHAPPPAGSVLTPIMGGRRCAGSPSTQRPRPDRQRRSQCPTRLGPPTLRRWGPGPQENTPGDARRADLAPGGLARPTFAAESRASDAPGAPGMTETKRLGDPRATKLARVHPRLRACWHRRRAARWPRSPPAPAARARNTPAATGHEYRLAAGRASHDRRSSAGFAVGGGDMRRHPPCRGPCRGPP